MLIWLNFILFLLCFVSTKSLYFTLNFRIIILGLCRIISSWTSYWTRFGPLSDQIILVKSRACSQSDRILQVAHKPYCLIHKAEKNRRERRTPHLPPSQGFSSAPKSVEPLLISAAGGVGHPVACAPVGPYWRNWAIRLLTSAMRPIRLPEPPSGLMGMPEIFEGGVNVIRRAVVIGNGSAGSENQSLGLVRALGLSDKYSIHVRF